MNRREAVEIAAYSAAVMFYKVNAIMCHLMPGDTFSFPHTETRYKAIVTGKQIGRAHV